MAMTRNQKVGIAAGGIAAIVAIFAFAGEAEAAPDGGDVREPWKTPLDPDPGAAGIPKKIDQAICDCDDSGIKGEAAVAKCVAESIWPGVPFPPVPGDHASLHQAWRLINERIASFIKAVADGTAEQWCIDARKAAPIVAVPKKPDDRGPTEPAPTEPEPAVVVVVPTGPKKVDLEPWVNPDNYPTPGTFYDVEYGDMFLGDTANRIVRRALYSAGTQAGITIGGLDPSDAFEWAGQIAKNANKRIQYLDLILCSPWNDALYGTWGFTSLTHKGLHGRSIRLLPQHPNNRERISQGLPPLRNIELGEPGWHAQGRKANPVWGNLALTHEFLWLPPLDLAVLFNQQRIEVDPTPWPNADPVLASRLFPPPVVSDLFIESAADVPDGMIWGCPGFPQMAT